MHDLMRGRLKLVTLMADPSDEQLAAVTWRGAPDFLQLHGGESARRVAYMRARFGAPVIKAAGRCAKPADLDRRRRI